MTNSFDALRDECEGVEKVIGVADVSRRGGSGGHGGGRHGVGKLAALAGALDVEGGMLLVRSSILQGMCL